MSGTTAYVVFPNGSRLAFPISTPFFTTPSSPQTAPGRFYGSYLSRSTGSELILNLRDGSQWGFGYYGAKLKWLQDRNGNRLNIERSSSTGPVNRIVSPSGRFVEFKYNASNLVESITDHIGRKFTYTYSLINSQRLLTQVTDPLGGTRNYAWDARSHGVGSCKPVNRITQITDPNGRIMVSNSYAWEPKCEALGSSTPVIGISGGRGSAGGTFNGSGSVMQPVGTAPANPPATLTEPCYIRAQTLADGSTFTCTRTLTLVSGNTYRISSTQVTDRRGNVRRAEFDINGRIVKDTFPVGKPEEQVQQFERDANGRMTAEIDALNRRTEYLYDASGNITQVKRLAGSVNAVSISTTYNAQSQPLTVTDPLGQITRFAYDTKGNLSKVTNPLNQSWLIARNAQGQATQLTDPLSNVSTRTYYGPDLVGSTDALGRQSTRFADSAGRILATTSPGGAQTQSRYDVMNRLTQDTNAQGSTVQFEYDANGNVTVHKDEKGNATRYAYNTLGKVMTKTDALNQLESYQYEAGGKLSRKTDRKGQVSGVTYDGHGRPTLIGFGATAAAPTTYQSTVTLTWDKGNRLTRIVDSVSGTINRTYDTLDRMTQETSPQGTIAYTYDKAGKRQSQTVTGQPTVSYPYDGAGQLTQISQAAGASNNDQAQVVKFQYDAAGRRTKTTLANGSVIEYTYDKASQLTSLTHKKADNIVLGSLTYTYDLNGKRTSASGSLASIELPNAVTGTAFDANNRLTQHNGATYTYDANGNMTSDGQRNYVWDERNQLKNLSGGAVANFVYDSMGRRIAKTVAGVTTGYLYDGQNFVQERAGLGSATAVKANLLTGGIDETFLRSEAGATATLSHFLTDANNNVIALTDKNQAIVTSYKYTPYGETTRTGAANTNSQQYTGRENDQTGLMYYRARYYHLGCNRFISEDPIGWASGQTNNYAYVGGDPVGFIDPLGLASEGTKPSCESIHKIPPAPPGANVFDNMDVAKKIDVAEFIERVQNNGPWDYKRQGRQYEDFGNYNFGAAAWAQGIPDSVALRGAGWYQQHRGAGGGSGDWWGLPPYGDQLRDNLLIQLGQGLARDYSSGRCTR